MTNINATAMTLAPSVEATVALEAAPIAFNLGRKFGTDKTIVLRAKDFADVHASLRIALESIAMPRLSENLLTITAERGGFGASIVEHTEFEESHKLVVVASVTSAFPIDDNAQASVLWALARETDKVLRANKSHAVLNIVVLETV